MEAIGWVIVQYLMKSFIITFNILEGPNAADDSNLKLIFWSTR